MDYYAVYELLFLFFIYAFLGWCAEVCFHAVVTGKFINRGFLNGPVCPIYGIGVVCVVYLLEPVKHNGLLLFLCSLVLTSVLEFITGFLLEKFFHARWWDYSNEPFHIGPYVCLRFSLMWGFACVFVVRLLQPFILLCIGFLPQILGVILLAFFSLTLLVDFFVTVSSINKILGRLKRLEELAEDIHRLSDRIGGRISDSTLEVVEKQKHNKERLEEAKDQLEERWEEQKERWEEQKDQVSFLLEEYKAEFQDKLSELPLLHRRILTAFPHLRMEKHQGVLESLRQAVESRRNDKKS